MSAVTENILEVHDLVQRFDQPYGFFDMLCAKKRRSVNAVNGVSFNVKRAEVFSLVGESGCGKSTTARTVVRLLSPRSGKVIFDGEDISDFSSRRMLPVRRRMQMIFQDPYSSLNPRQKVKDILMEPMLFHKVVTSKEHARARMEELLNLVGLSPEQGERYPHQFSGGQRQRIGIARALSTNPVFVVADEPVSALDVSVQAQVLNLMMDLKDKLKLSYLFIAHNLSVVRHVTDKLAIMYLGYIVEHGDRDFIFDSPKHPYTKALLAAAPTIDNLGGYDRPVLHGDVPSPMDLPAGCPFVNRCPESIELCSKERPVLKFTDGRYVACHLQ